MGKAHSKKRWKYNVPEDRNKRMIMKNTTETSSCKHCQTSDLKNLHYIKHYQVENTKFEEMINQRWKVSSWPPKIGMKECLYGK